MKKIALFVVFALGIFLLSACGGGGETKSNNQQAQQTEVKEEVAEVEQTDNGMADMLALGKKIYDEKCVACHQANAEGLPGVFPPLKNSDYLLADLNRGVLQTLKGSDEPMVVNGQTYTTPMPPQVETMEEAVAVINYVLKEFNGFEEEKLLTMEDVKDLHVE